MAIARAAAIAGAAAIATGAAVIAGGTYLWKRSNEAQAPAAICLKRDVPLFEGAAKKCYAPAEIGALADAAVLGEDGAPGEVSLSHPTNTSTGLQIAHNCAQFRKMKADGWFPLSTKEMRRDAWFTRACGVLATLERAQPPQASNFDKGSLSEADMKSLAEGPPFQFGPEFEMPAAPAKVSRADNGWRLSSGGQSALIEEIAHADFNGDGRGDMLVFVTLNVDDGTATASEVGLLDKPNAAGPVRFVKR